MRTWADNERVHADFEFVDGKNCMIEIMRHLFLGPRFSDCVDYLN